MKKKLYTVKVLGRMLVFSVYVVAKNVTEAEAKVKKEYPRYTLLPPFEIGDVII